jgi:hypothetical protein
VVGSCSDGSGEFGERGRDAPMRPDFDAEFVVTASDVLHERVPADDHACSLVAFEPRIGLSRALSRPWSASIRLFAYCSVLWNASGMSSSITARSADARSVTTSTGMP